MERLAIAVLFGGRSCEYHISLQSAHAVLQHLDEEKYLPVMVGITQAGEWYRFTGDAAKIAADTWCNETDCVEAVLSPCTKTHGLLERNTDGVREIRIDAAMPVLHGKNGEDGTVQGLLELAGIPVIGCKASSSALCMDKGRAHMLACQAGVKVPKSFVLTEQGMDIHLAMKCAEVCGYPLFVKPVKAGSSYGISKIAGEDELTEALREAFIYDDEVVIEEVIPGFEVGCALMGSGTQLVTGQLDEIELDHGFFDNVEKYTLKTATIHIPARLSPSKSDEVIKTAKTIYKALGCSGFARVDMFLKPDGTIVFNEVNTIPGLTPFSRFPNMLNAVGIPFAAVLDHIIRASFDG